MSFHIVHKNIYEVQFANIEFNNWIIVLISHIYNLSSIFIQDIHEIISTYSEYLRIIYIVTHLKVWWIAKYVHYRWH